jgi:hypothetical protein
MRWCCSRDLEVEEPTPHSRCPRIRRPWPRQWSTLTFYSTLWIVSYIVGAALTAVGVFVPGSDWLCGVVFCVALGSIVLHLVNASLTRRVPVIRLIVGLNVVVFAAVALTRDKISSQAAAGIVGSVPLLSYFGYWFWRLASAPPRPGEALRPAKQLRECSWAALATVSAVLCIEFVQLNAVPFNAMLGAWRGLPDLNVAFTLTFLEFAGSETSFETELWVYVEIAVDIVSRRGGT